tara:strand:- start:278 stop:604 length:327 start_codon:yes stop_codon:yes gene_type:complete
MTINQLIKIYNRLYLKFYGSEVKSLRLPTNGGYLELDLEFNNGLINVTRAILHFMGFEKTLDNFVGYTCELGLSRMTFKLFDDSCDALQDIETLITDNNLSPFLANEF